MFSAKERSSPDLDFRRKASKLLASKTGGEFSPRLSMRIWLTALFVLVTAFAAITAYEIVHPILYETLNRSSEAAFKQVGDQFEDQVQRLRERGEPVTEQRINAFARSHGLQWGIVRAGEACRRGAQKAERRHGTDRDGRPQRTAAGHLRPSYKRGRQRQGRASASGSRLRQVLHGERHR